MPEREEPNSAQARADALHEEALARSEAGDEEAALALYLEALALDRARPDTAYNVGLIYKYRRDWESSLRYNLMAVEHRPDDPATNWNTGIAATALRQWRVAREAWHREGMKMEINDEAIVENFGSSVVRLNGFEDRGSAIETVWVQRLSPVTARIENIPTPEARYRFGDVVLHDGAATGYRKGSNGQEYPVFNAFDLFEASPFETFDVLIDAPGGDTLDLLEQAAEQAGMYFEDWTTMRHLCRACSEGRPHEQHDHDQPDTEWQTERRIGIASRDADMVTDVLEKWCADGTRRVLSINGED